MDLYLTLFIALLAFAVGLGAGILIGAHTERVNIKRHVKGYRDRLAEWIWDWRRLLRQWLRDNDEILRLTNENEELSASLKASDNIIEHYLGSKPDVIAGMHLYAAGADVDEYLMRQKESHE